LVLLGVGGIFGGLWALFSRLIQELEELLARLTQDGIPTIETLTERLPAWLASAIRALPFFGGGEDGSLLSRVMQMVSDALSARLPSLLGAVVGAMPQLLLSLIVALIAAVYFCLDLEKINAYLLSLLPTAWAKRLISFKQNLWRTAFSYLRSYLILMGITFALLLVGFLFIGVNYALLLAAIISVVDLFPVLGVGTVLIPWSVGCFLFGDIRGGIGLGVLYLICFILRQYLEPHLVGSSLGIHPLAALFFMYGGFQLGGVIGMLLAPLICILLLSLFSSSQKSAAPPCAGPK
jgi:sporulation integral membrane protein YtvI